MYDIAMAKDISAPTSIRVPEELEPELAKFMEARSIKKRGTAIITLMRERLMAPANVIQASPSKHPRVIHPAPSRGRWSLQEAGVQLGPNPPAPRPKKGK